MKSKVHAVLMVAAVLLIPAIGAIIGSSSPSFRVRQADQEQQIRLAIAPDSRFSVWADPETGCEYVIYHSREFAPRLSTDGSPKGCREIEAMKLEPVQ